MDIETIHIPGLTKQSIKIACLQLTSPFYNEISEFRGENNKAIFGVAKKNEKKFIKKTKEIHEIIETTTKKLNLDFVILPEYTFLKDDNIILEQDQSSLDICNTLAEATNTVIIGNFYNSKDRLSTTFISMPQGYADQRIYYVNKQTVSNLDKSVLKNRSDFSHNDKKLLRFIWEEKLSKRQAFFQIFTCKDYLYFTSIHPLRKWPDILDIGKPGIIFVPMSTTVIKPFEDRALSLLRDVNFDNGEKSIVSVFSNATTTHDLIDNDICGNSQIICPIDIKREVKPLLKKGVDGIVYAEINPFKSITKPTKVGEMGPNAVMIDSSVYEFTRLQNKLTLVETQKAKKHTGLIVNPNFLEYIGIKKIYGLLRHDNYNEVKECCHSRFSRLKDLSISMHGIYGVHDMIVFSYEEYYDKNAGKQLLEVRLWPMIKGEEYFNKEHFGCLYVDKILKYRGIIIDGNNFETIRYQQNDILKIKTIIKNILTSNEIEEKYKEYFLKNEILLKSEFDISDISEYEKNEGKLEFLVILTLFESDQGPQAKDLHHTFSEKVLPAIIADRRIRTIEKISSGGTGFVSGHYMLHVVGDLLDLNNIVIHRLHKLLRGQRCGTRVIIPAERIAFNDYPTLSETIKTTATEPQLMQIIKRWRAIENDPEKMVSSIIPTIINVLDDDSRKTILSIYYHADELANRYATNNPDWSKNLFLFMYGITVAIAGKKHNLDISDAELLNYCSSFILIIARTIERELIELFERIIELHQLDISVLEKSLNLLVAAIKKSKGSFKLNKVEIGTAAFILESLSGYCQPDSKHVEKTKKHFNNELANDETTNSHIDYIDIICSELFNVQLKELDRELVQYLDEEELQKIREHLKNNDIPISSNLKITKKDDKWLLRDKGEIFIIEDRGNNLHLHYQIITKEMLSGINTFAICARNRAPHTEYGHTIYPQEILSGTYSGLKFLENISLRVDRRLFNDKTLFGMI